MRRRKGPRLYLRKPRRDKRRGTVRPAEWVILDGEKQTSTGCGRDDRAGSEEKLEQYLNKKHAKEAKKSVRDPAEVFVADVLGLYSKNVIPSHSRPKESLQRVDRLLAFSRGKTLADVNGDFCRAFAKTRSTPTAARDDLTLLRAAINHHREEGHCDKIVGVVLPPKPVGRERWCTRSEIARILWAAWRFRETQKGVLTDRRSRRHVARFVIVALYTGTRAGAVCGAALQPTEGRGWIDLDKGIFYRRPAGARETKKRRSPVPLPRRLLAHLRRWKRAGQASCVEWNGKPVRDCDKAFRNVAKAAGLPDVTPHVLRHTAATWLMQLGAPTGETAEFLAMTEKMLVEVYGHHHPDYLLGPRDAFDRAPKARQIKAATDREQTSSNVTKITNKAK